MEISLCMIVRNEEENLGRCLQSVRDAVDEIMLVGPRFSALFLSVLAQGMRQDGGYQLPTLGKKSFFSSIKKSQA